MPTTAFNAKSLSFRPTLPSQRINTLEQNSPQFYNFPSGSGQSSSSSESSLSSQASCNENSKSPLRSPDTTTYDEICGEVGPYLEIVEQPYSGFRFRYKTEMQGTHGAILGAHYKEKRGANATYPKVKLTNYRSKPGENVIIRVSLCTADQDETKRILHVHRLMCKKSGKVVDDPHDIPVQAPDFTAHFQLMTILYTKKEDQLNVLMEKKRYHTLRKFTNTEKKLLYPLDEFQMRAQCIEELKSMNFHLASLKFEALLDNGKGRYIQLCPPKYSNIIKDLKNAHTTDLRICRLDQCMGPCMGGQEVFMFVERVVKTDIRVKFFEKDENSTVVWEAYADFRPEDVHHQYGIVFKTPPYRNNNISRNTVVYLQLERPSDGACSAPRRYEYIPNPECSPVLSRKRPRQQNLRIIEPRANSNEFFPMLQYPVQLSKEPSNIQSTVTALSELPPLTVTEHIPTAAAVPTLENSEPFSAGMFDPALLEDDLLKEFLLDYERMDMTPIATDEGTRAPNLTSIISDLSHHLPPDESDIFSGFCSNGRFDEYLLLNGEEDWTNQMSHQVSSSDDREFNVMDGCVAPPRVQANTTQLKESHKSKGKKDQRQNPNPVRDILTPDNIVVKVESSVDTLVQLQRAGKIENKTLRNHLLRFFQYATIKQTGDSVLHVLASFNEMPLPPQVSKFIDLLKSHKIYEILELRNKNSETPLLVAARRGMPEMVSLLLDAGANVNAKDNDNNTSVHQAVMRDQAGLEILSNLFPRLPDLIINNKDGDTPLHMAVRRRNADIVSFLCMKSEYSTDPCDLINCEEKKHGNTALHIAVSSRYKEIVKILLNFDKTLNVNAKNFAEKTPLAFVWNYSDAEAVEIRELLIEKKADPWLVETKSKKDEYKEEEDIDSDDDALHIVEDQPVIDGVSSYEREWRNTKLFDAKTISKLCPLLDKNHDWRIIGKRLNFSDIELDSCEDYWSSSLVLFILISDYRPNMTPGMIRDILLSMPAHLHIGAQYIDDMELKKMGI